VLQSIHPAMPGDDLRVRGGQLVVAGVKKISEHPE
jgi:hypothetical protein